MRLVWASISSVESTAGAAQHLLVNLDDGSAGRAVAYVHMVGECIAGERVLLNTTAVDLDLGTGGLHFVVARGTVTEGVAFERVSGGRTVKVRYTPSQVDVLTVEEQESPHHAVMKEARSLMGMPVACCGLHSQVPLVAAAVKQADPSLKVAYVMTDQGALPLALSDVASRSVDAGLLDSTVSCGQAFGGDFEAVGLHSGLLAARHVARADVAIVAIGPGVTGTATPFGHGGVAQGEAINAVTCLGGIPIAVLRVSFADSRSRHRAVSHHSLAALSTIALGRAYVPVPHLPEDYAEAIEQALEEAGVFERHVRFDSAAGRVAPPSLKGVEVKTMGRGFADDPAFFAASFAAGDACAKAAHGELPVL